MNLPEDWSANTVRANGIEVQYYRTGEGLPLVMAYGFYDNGRCWAPLAADLADDYDLVMYDARGHGRSDAPEAGYAIEDRVDDLVGLVDALSLVDPILLGHSMGGSTVA
ncbi:alpha/beta fold hydrolase [Haladaptatus sp. NG-WS-4]